MQKKKLPIGIQTFREIRSEQENYIYIDKTSNALDLINKAKYYFLSRPRRFGKSLFVDTLDEIFSGSKELFEGLYIYDKWDWNETFPVIRIDFTTGNFSSQEFIINRIKVVLEKNTTRFEINFAEIDSLDLGTILENLILKLYQKYNQKVVVLIDEYDKPILDNIGKVIEQMTLAREILRSFYGAIKGSDRYLKFVFITGVSKFAKLNLFSGLNNIEDITIDSNYATITGYTHHDLKSHFTDYLDNVDLELVKKWYNGYNYFGEPIYNPFDILLFFSKGGEFSNYWWETGNPAFLVEKLKEEHHFLPDLQNIEATNETLNSFDVEHIDLVALLWQTGYLTFDKKTGDASNIFYKMKVPNLEIQKSLNALFFDYLANIGYKKNRMHLSVLEAVKNKNIELLKTNLVAMFASIPYQNYANNIIANYEGYYASVMFAFMASMGFVVKAEESTNLGRIDMTMETDETVYVIEFKVDMPTEAALHQIETRKYYEKFQNSGKEIILIGMHFNSEIRNIENLEWRVK